MAGTELHECTSPTSAIPPGRTARQNGPPAIRTCFARATRHRMHSLFSSSRILAGVEQVPQVGQVASGGILAAWYQVRPSSSLGSGLGEMLNGRLRPFTLH